MIAIKARTINTITRGILENGSILIENGKIIDVGENLDVSQAAEIIELDNGYVMPGLNIQEIFLS